MDMGGAAASPPKLTARPVVVASSPLHEVGRGGTRDLGSGKQCGDFYLRLARRRSRNRRISSSSSSSSSF